MHETFKKEFFLEGEFYKIPVISDMFHRLKIKYPSRLTTLSTSEESGITNVFVPYEDETLARKLWAACGDLKSSRVSLSF